MNTQIEIDAGNVDRVRPPFAEALLARSSDENALA